MDLPITPILCQEISPFVGLTLTPELAAQLVARVTTRCYSGPVDTSHIGPKTVGSYTLRCVRVADIIDQLRPIHLEHWQETETYRHGVEFKPDYQRGIDLEEQGRYVLVAAFEADTGELVGNYGIYLARSMHTQKRMATEDTLFVSKAHRRGRLGIALMRYTEHVLMQLGVEEFNVSVKVVNNVGPMLERMGFSKTGSNYTKILKEAAHVQA